jgi:hypothetical protein
MIVIGALDVIFYIIFLSKAIIYYTYENKKLKVIFILLISKNKYIYFNLNFS